MDKWCAEVSAFVAQGGAIVDDALFLPHLRFHKSVFKEFVHGEFVAWLVVVHSAMHERIGGWTSFHRNI